MAEGLPTSSPYGGTVPMDKQGNPYWPIRPLGKYIVGFAVRHIATDAAGSIAFALLNPNPTTVTGYIKNIRGTISFDGTAAAGTSCGYEFIRYGSGTGLTGGTALTVTKKVSTDNAPVLVAMSGVGTAVTAGVAANSPFHIVRQAVSVTGVNNQFWIDPYTAGADYEPLTLAAGETYVIRLNLVAVVGFSIAGSIEWDER